MSEKPPIFHTMPRPPPPLNFPQPFPKPGTENNSRNATRSATRPQPAAGSPPEPAVYLPQVPNRDDGTYLPQQRAPHTPVPSSAPPAVRQHTRPPAHAHAHAPAPALTHSYSSSPPHPLSPLPPSGSVPPPLTFPTPSVLGGYGASGLVRPPSPPMTERATTTYEYNVQGAGYRNVATPCISHQRSAAVGRSHQDGGSSSNGNHNFEQSPDMDDYVAERAPTFPPFAGTGRRHPSRQHTGQVQEHAQQPDLPCKLCRDPTSPKEHARLGGFCSERHKWEWDSRQNQNQSWQGQNRAQQNQNPSWQSQNQPQQHQNPSWQNQNQSQQNQNPSRQNQNQPWQDPNQSLQNQNSSYQWQNQDQPQQHQNPSWQNPNQSQQNQNLSRQNQDQPWQDPNQSLQNQNSSWPNQDQPQQHQNPSWPNPNRPQRNQNQSRRKS